LVLCIHTGTLEPLAGLSALQSLSLRTIPGLNLERSKVLSRYKTLKLPEVLPQCPNLTKLDLEDVLAGYTSKGPKAFFLHMTGGSDAHWDAARGDRAALLNSFRVNHSGETPFEFVLRVTPSRIQAHVTADPVLLRTRVNHTQDLPLHIVAANGRVDLVRFMLHLGAPLAAKNARGRTAEDLARANGHGEVADLLRRSLRPLDSRCGTGLALSQALRDRRAVTRVEWHRMHLPGLVGNLARAYHSVLVVSVGEGDDQRRYILEKSNPTTEVMSPEERGFMGVFISDWSELAPHAVGAPRCVLTIEELSAAGQGATMHTLYDFACRMGPYIVGRCNCHHMALAVYNHCAAESSRLKGIPNEFITAVAAVLEEWFGMNVATSKASCAVSLSPSLSDASVHGFRGTGDQEEDKEEATEEEDDEQQEAEEPDFTDSMQDKREFSQQSYDIEVATGQIVDAAITVAKVVIGDVPGLVSSVVDRLRSMTMSFSGETTSLHESKALCVFDRDSGMLFLGRLDKDLAECRLGFPGFRRRRYTLNVTFHYSKVRAVNKTAWNILHRTEQDQAIELVRTMGETRIFADREETSGAAAEDQATKILPFLERLRRDTSRFHLFASLRFPRQGHPDFGCYREAKLLKTELAKRGAKLHNVRIRAGKNSREIVHRKMHRCSHLVAFGCKDYAERTGMVGDTCEELDFWKGTIRKDQVDRRIISINMLRPGEHHEHQAQLEFEQETLPLSWPKRTPLPDGLVGAIMGRIEGDMNGSGASV